MIRDTQVAVVGTGFAGIGASIALRRAGVDHVVLERADDLGGTWRDNTYPGCRCDVPSHLYSFSFAPNPDWGETYSSQSEIQDYLRRTAEAHDVPRRTLFGHELIRAGWRGDEQHWVLETSGGTVISRILVMGHGPLAEPSIPDIPGLDRFAGTMFHSSRWDHDHDLSGRRVAVIGTGASAIQFVPEIQPSVEHLTVFQRTPPWVLPHRNRTIRPWERALYRSFPPSQRLVRAFVYWSRELLGLGMVRNAPGLDRLEELARGHLRQQVHDRELRDRLVPDYRPGCKRLLISNTWYPALQRSNVALVDDEIAAVGAEGVVTADGRVHPADTIIFGTGFRVIDNPIAERIHGADGRTLAQAWEPTGPVAYLGTTVSGFPNLFLLAGPNTGIGHTSLVVMIEAQLGYLIDAIGTMRKHRATSVEVRPSALRGWSEEVRRRAEGTVWNSGGCASWYLDEEGRNSTQWPDLSFRFVRRCRRFDVERYDLRRGVTDG